MAIITAYIDGASRGQGFRGDLGIAACAAAIYRNNKEVAQLVRGLGRRTNNEAEYEALILVLLYCAGAGDLLDPIIYSDSELVVKQVNNEWRCNTENLFPLLFTVHEIRESFRFRLEHVRRPQVALADALCNDYLDRMTDAWRALGIS